MCFGSKSNNSTPAPAPVARFDYNAADTSNDQQRKNAATSTTAKPAAFGSELGAAPSTALTGGSTTMPGGA